MDRMAKIVYGICASMSKTVEKAVAGSIWYTSVRFEAVDGINESVTFYKVTDFNPEEDRIDFAEIGKKQSGGSDEYPLMVPDESKIIRRIPGLKFSVCIKENNGEVMCVCPYVCAKPWDSKPFKEEHKDNNHE